MSLIRRRQRMKTIIYLVVSLCLAILVLNLALTGKLSSRESNLQSDLIQGRLAVDRAVTVSGDVGGKKRFSEDVKGTTLNAFDRIEKYVEVYRQLGRHIIKDGNYSEVKFPPFVEYGTENSPGEMGRPHQLNESVLTDWEKDARKENFDLHWFDEWISKDIAVHRSLEDYRSPECKSKEYGDLPVSSVVIVFYNEAWTTLLRTLHSVLDRTSQHLLLEIVLVDDFSTMEHLKLPLEKYLQPLEKVRLIRATRRLGLQHARNLGYVNANGEIIIFMDSHVECFSGWLEPLVNPLKNDSKVVAYPILDKIDPYTFAVTQQGDTPLAGTINIHSMAFTWMTANLQWNAGADTWKSPVLPGGVFAISRDWFGKLAITNPETVLLGDEDIEMSFKVWMCGGSILVSSCSHVAHITYQHFPTYEESANNLQNSIRVAEIWMDEYKHFFYEKLAYNLGTASDVTDGLELRKSLQCQNFEWYLTNVNFELKRVIDESSMYCGQIKNVATNLCLEAKHEDDVPILAPCALGNYAQIWMLRTDGALVCYESLLGAYPNTTNNPVTYRIQMAKGINVLEPTEDVIKQQWVYDNTIQWLSHQDSNLCLGVEPTDSDPFLKLAACTEELTMKWFFQLRLEMRNDYKGHPDVWIDWTAGG